MTPDNPALPASDWTRVLSNPWLDRAIAVIACLPFVYFGYYRYVHDGINFPLIALWFEFTLIIVPMVARRPPKRVTPNPWFWLLTFVETYWGLVPALMGPGHLVGPPAASNSLALCSLVIAVWARVYLGRNIGFVPAQRELVARGPYRFVRHPIYTGIMLSYIAIALRDFSPRNALFAALGILWFLLKTLAEESFLRADPTYASYMQRVRARWFPLVA
jgi:protein-S-isoprenylcysteine O-methyltransferase Ste14